VLARGATERFAVTSLMVIEHRAGRRSFEDDRHAPLAIDQRQTHQILAIELKRVEHEIGEPGPPV
jgi:hypothetical protein